MTDDDEARVLEVLEKIHDGALTVSTDEVMGDIFFGDVIYEISNGWKITVFVDGDEFDYIDNVVTEDGTVFDFDEIWKLAEVESGEITPREDGWNRVRNYRGCSCDLRSDNSSSHWCARIVSRIWGASR